LDTLFDLPCREFRGAALSVKVAPAFFEPFKPAFVNPRKTLNMALEIQYEVKGRETLLEWMIMPIPFPQYVEPVSRIRSIVQIRADGHEAIACINAYRQMQGKPPMEAEAIGCHVCYAGDIAASVLLNLVYNT